MDMDSFRQIGPSDLATLKNTPTDSVASSAVESYRKTTCPPTSAWNSSTSSETCDGCGGVGHYLLSVPYGHPKWGVMQVCECKLQRDNARIASELGQRLRAERGVYADATLADYDWFRDTSEPAPWEENQMNGVARVFSPAQQQKSLRAAQAAMDRYAATLDGGLFLTGPYGTGKTHLGVALANLVTAQGRGAQYVSTPVLMKDLRAGIADHSTDKRLEEFIRLDFLVLDDLGTEHLSDWGGSLMFDLINERYNAKRATVVTSNYPISAIPGRIGSRLVQMCEIVSLIAYDYRSIIAKRRKQGAA